MATVNFNITDADPNVVITVTDPDGAETTTTADENGAATVVLNKEGEWTFTYTSEGTEKTANHTVSASDLTTPTLGTDDVMHITEKQFQHALIRILQKNNERIVAHFTDKVTPGDTNHVATSDAVAQAIAQAIIDGAEDGTEAANKYTDEKIAEVVESILGINNWSYVAITGPLPEDPDTKTIYLQRDDEDDPTYIMKIYSNGTWIDIGDTSIDLLDYWAKDNIEGLTDALVNNAYFMSMLFTGKAPEESTNPGESIIVKATPGATVTATHPDGDKVTVTADDDGIATLTVTKVGAWAITITEPETIHPDVVINDNEDGDTVSESVIVKATPGATVTATHPDGDEVTATANENGIATLTLTKVGAWAITISEPTEVHPDVTVSDTDADTNTTTPIVIKATPGAKVTATLVDSDPVVTVVATADENGDATFTLDTEGTWTFSIEASTTPVPDVEVEAPGDSDGTTTTPIVIKATPGVKVTATLNGSDPVVTVTSTADKDGNATFILSQEGTWSFSVDDETSTVPDVEVTDPAIPDTDFDSRYYRRSNPEDIVEDLIADDTFFNRKDNQHYADAWKLLGPKDNKDEALASTGISDDETVVIKTAAIDALDSLNYIRHSALAKLLGIENPDSITQLTPEQVSEAISFIVKDNVDDLEDTFMSNDTIKDYLGIPDDEELTKESFIDYLVKTISDNQNMLETITDARLDELLDVAFEATVVNLANSGIATDDEVQLHINNSFGVQ